MMEACNLFQRIEHPESPPIRLGRVLVEPGIRQILGPPHRLRHDDLLEADAAHPERVDGHRRERLQRRERVWQQHQVGEVGERNGE